MLEDSVLQEELEAGLHLCRLEEWERGLEVLAALAEKHEGLPGVFYSYLGYGMALQENRIHEGRRLCRHAIKVEFYRAENYYNLARTEMLVHNRRAAWRALEKGLAVEAENPRLLALQREMGQRRPPVLGFLPRSNPFNRALGFVRHLFS
ncbi:MAG: hypothetical protein AAF604_08375 [Acidobacteriota bacterium]